MKTFICKYCGQEKTDQENRGHGSCSYYLDLKKVTHWMEIPDTEIINRKASPETDTEERRRG
jgi:hypothetical protein